MDLAKNPEKIPDGWKNYLLDHIVWDYIKKHPRTFSKMFDEVHAAIDEFKGVIAALSAKYQTKTKVHILKKPQDGKLELPYLDSIIAIDAYTTIPNLVWNFEYNLSPLKAPAQFMALNKISPQGVFYEPVSNEPVNISVYDIVHSTTGNYRLSLIEEQRIKPTQAQEAKVPEKDYVRNIFGN